MAKLIKSIVKQHKIRDFMLTAAFYLSLAAIGTKAQAQTPTAPENTSAPNKPKTALTYDVNVGFDNLSALIVDENTTNFYNDLMPTVSASVENSKGDKAQISAVEQLLYDENKFTAELSTLMIECYKKIKNNGDLFLKVGRDNTQGNDDILPAIDYMNDTKDDEAFSNNALRMVLGYQKNDSFFELGVIQYSGDGHYAFIPNMKEVDFFGKGHLSAPVSADGEFSAELAAYLGKHNRMGFANINFVKGKFGAKALFQHDFKNNDSKYLLRAYQKLNSGIAIIEEFAHRGKDCGVDFRLCAGKNGLQAFVLYNTAEKQLQIGTSYFFGIHKKINQK